MLIPWSRARELGPLIAPQVARHLRGFLLIQRHIKAEGCLPSDLTKIAESCYYLRSSTSQGKYKDVTPCLR